MGVQKCAWSLAESQCYQVLRILPVLGYCSTAGCCSTALLYGTSPLSPFCLAHITLGCTAGFRSDATTPQEVPALKGSRVKLVAGGWRHMLAADESGTLWAWGWGKFGQLGLGNNADVVDTPQRVEVSAGK